LLLEKQLNDEHKSLAAQYYETQRALNIKLQALAYAEQNVALLEKKFSCLQASQIDEKQLLNARIEKLEKTAFENETVNELLTIQLAEMSVAKRFLANRVNQISEILDEKAVLEKELELLAASNRNLEAKLLTVSQEKQQQAETFAIELEAVRRENSLVTQSLGTELKAIQARLTQSKESSQKLTVSNQDLTTHNTELQNTVKDLNSQLKTIV